MDHIADTVRMLLKACRPSEIEIEARIRRQLVNGGSCAALVKALDIGWKESAYTERRKISKSSRRSSYRQRGSVAICKSSIAKEELNDEWCTLHVSTEMPTPSMSRSLADVPPVQITRHRGEIDGCYVDVIHDEVQGHRVEVEVKNANAFDQDSMIAVVKRVCAALNGCSAPFLGYYDWFTVIHVTKQRFGPFCIDSGSYQRPRTMTIDALVDISRTMEGWLATPKVDGERRFVVGINCRVFSIGLGRDVRPEGDSTCEGIFILDCEYDGAGGSMYHVFDVVVVEGQYIGDTAGLTGRLEMASAICSKMSEELRARTCIKAHCTFASFDALCKLCKEFMGHSSKTDGVIFVDTSRGYMQQVVKWKPESTVDLMVENGRTLVTSDGFIVDIPVERQVPAGIWEFAYDRHKNVMVPHRARPDKPQANSKMIVTTNMHRAVPGSVFTGIICYLMRKYHNRVKRQMVSKANDSMAVIVDIGTGQGGDVDKWNRASAVYCIEPSASATQDMVRRHGNRESIKVINVHLRDLDCKLINKKVDIFTAFFCTNQFEDADWDALDTLIKSRGSTRCRLLVIAMTAPRNHSSECFDIAMKGDEVYSIDIHSTRIRGIDERVVKASSMTKRMEECGLGLIERARLDDEPFMTQEERLLSSMYEMFVYKKGAAL